MRRERALGAGMGFGERKIARTEGPWKLPERWLWATVSDLPMGV